MVLKNTMQLLSSGGEAFFICSYDSPYFYIYNKLSKNEKWGKYMKDVKNMTPEYVFWENVTEMYKEKAMEAGLQTVSCEVITKQHEYIPYLFWRSVNPYLPRIKDADEKEEFIEALHQLTMNYPKILPDYPSSWSKLLVVHLRKP